MKVKRVNIGRSRNPSSSFIPHPSSFHAFTIIELLVVIGIIAVLIGLLLPMTMRAFRSADRTRTAADLNAIATALDAYKVDFGDYPRVDPLQPGTGFAILCKALVGPGPASATAANAVTPSAPYAAGAVNFNTTPAQQLVALRQTNTAPVAGTDWANLSYADGADGEGFRVRWDPATNVGGAIKPAYLQSGKFKIRGLAILDHNDHPVLYFPQSPTKINLNTANGYYVASQNAVGPANRTMYNFDDNAVLATSLTIDDPNQAPALRRMQAIMGDLPGNGRLLAGATPITTAPYLLWSVGADGFFGTTASPASFPNDSAHRDAVNKCDDVTNFR